MSFLKFSSDYNILKADLITLSLELTHDDYKKVDFLLSRELACGLKSTKESTIKMFLTYVRSLPNNEEQGQYLALDLGGTNFRVLLVEFTSSKQKILDCERHEIPNDLRFGSGQSLFDFIAERVIQFAIRHQLVGVRIALGFTFSFPLHQHGLAEATLVRWTKSFNCSGVVGFDVVRLLKAALKRKMHKSIPYVDVVAIINDTTGTLISGALMDKNCVIGLIVGTGCNSCYVEKLENIEKWPFNYSEPRQVVINTEWGAFGENNVLDFIRTIWDRSLDYESVNAGKQTYEKMVSGMYLPELFRRVLLTLIERGVLFNGHVPLELLRPYSITTSSMSKIDMDTKLNSFRNTKTVLSELFVRCDYSDVDAKIVFMINNRITQRAAYLIATGIWALAKRIDQTDISVAYDGSLLCLHPYIKLWVEEKLNKFSSSTNKKIRLIPSHDGSGYGAAIVAALCYREKRPKIVKRNGKVYEVTSFLNK